MVNKKLHIITKIMSKSRVDGSVREIGSHEASGERERESCVQWERLCDGGMSHDRSGWIVRKIDN